jgi:glycosyltransferase involved in cell wall biosynthesis
MKILLLRPFKSDGGVGNYYDKIQSHYKCHVQYFHTGKSDNKVYKGISLIINYFKFTVEVIRKDYDLIHLNPSLRFNSVVRDGMFLLLTKLLRKKAVVFFRGWDDELENKIRKSYPKLFEFVYFSADAFIVLATRFKSVLKEMGCKKPIFLETTIVPDELFNFNKNNWSKNDKPENVNILFLSRIEKNKGVYEALDAFIILKRKYANLTMTVAGDGTELTAIKEYLVAKKVKDVKITGWIEGEEKVNAYSDADIYLFPTYHGEGMPNSLLEAMAHGLPVITRPVGGIKDFFLNGEMGFLTEGTDSLDLANLCEILVRDEGIRMSIGKFNRIYAKEHFLASKACDRLETIYFNVLHNKLEVED